MRVLIRLLAVGVAVAVMATASAPAQGKSRWYTYGKGTRCTKRVDPVNVVFYGRDATARRSASFISRYLRWGGAGDSDSQGFLTPGCRLANYQRADGGTREPRFHVRLRQRSGRDSRRRRATLAGAHHEDFVRLGGCPLFGKHAVDKGAVDRKREDRGRHGSGFDAGRNKIAARFRARGRRVQYRARRNTQSKRQCDGDYAGSDGGVAYITIPDRR